jgi:hypothetical protein
MQEQMTLLARLASEWNIRCWRGARALARESAPMNCFPFRLTLTAGLTGAEKI